jgi:hypothetical protein
LPTLRNVLEEKMILRATRYARHVRFREIKWKIARAQTGKGEISLSLSLFLSSTVRVALLLNIVIETNSARIIVPKWIETWQDPANYA